MLKFEENDRPSFIELAKLVLTSTENTIESPKGGKAAGATPGNILEKKVSEQQKKVNKTFSSQNFKENVIIGNLNQESNTVSNHAEVKITGKKGQMEESQQNLMTQSELFKSYADQNKLYLNFINQMFWFEFGGNKIGRLFIEGPEAEEFPKWRLIAKYKSEFGCHFTLVYINGGHVGGP
mmetsp:Transcript_12506/g.12274  ORF Transcript_12506/g.12274 Transcript_12506/m.12274 type:complete len:180 (-) Transcript_12506:752-1291(-)